MANESELLAEIKDLKAQLATAQAEPWRLIRSVCHELRLPLSSINGYNDLMPLAGPLNEQQEDFHARIKKNVGRMSHMITNLHELAVMGEGRFTPKLAVVSLAESIEKVRQEMQSLATEHGNVLTANVPASISNIQADREHFEQIVHILVENACIYTPSGGRVTVTAHPTDDDFAEVTVADTGIGVTEAERPRLFTLFFRGDVPLVREQIGSGMNLYMLRRFVEYMGGTYGAEFPAEGGSRFWVRLPRSS